MVAYTSQKGPSVNVLILGHLQMPYWNLSQLGENLWVFMCTLLLRKCLPVSAFLIRMVDLYHTVHWVTLEMMALTRLFLWQESLFLLLLLLVNKDKEDTLIKKQTNTLSTLTFKSIQWKFSVCKLVISSSILLHYF